MADFALTRGPKAGLGGDYPQLGYDAEFDRRANGKRDLRIVRGREARAQRLQMRLRTFLGECRYALHAGVPYVQILFAKGITISAFRSILEHHMLQSPGIEQVTKFELSLNPRTRELVGYATVSDAEGEFTLPLSIKAPLGS